MDMQNIEKQFSEFKSQLENRCYFEHLAGRQALNGGI